MTLNFISDMSAAVIFLDTENAFGTTWHFGLLYTCKLSELKFLISLIKLVSSFLFHRKFRVSVVGEMSAPRYIQAVMPQGSILSPTLCSIYLVSI
jgi:hypothetical protein